MVERDKAPNIFIKEYHTSNALNQVKAEADGLRILKQSGYVNSPDIVFELPLESGAALGMIHIEASHSGRRQSMAIFGKQLALLHSSKSNERFGYPINNYIGALPQTNSWEAIWPYFYYEKRLLPQLQMAVESGLLPLHLLQKKSQWIEVISKVYPPEPPALVHGDLWSGNLIANDAAQHYLIDPAVYYGHREMDLAMTHLFGGFDDSFYKAYNEFHPLIPGFAERMELSQLYYLLVHVNLFGQSYVGSTLAIIQKYMGKA